jgi:glycosyltransferase involved in cell wall biosynthesis
MNEKSYVVVTPVKDEAQFIEKTLESMLAQTTRPEAWVIVNDGSKDNTEKIVESYVVEYPWIKLVNREDRGFRKRGQGVVEAFYTGYEALEVQEYGFIIKLDGDVSFEPTYFESLLQEFAANPKLGIAGGGVYESPDGERWVLRTVKSHVRGATKMYRRSCFEDIGGLVPTIGWDGIDEWKALTLGWEVRSFSEFEMFHYRYTGMATGSLRSRVEEGHAAYYMGYYPPYMIARGIHHLSSRPYITGGIAMIAAFFADWIRGRGRLPDPSVIHYIRRVQLERLARLLRGKPIYGD